MSNPPPLHNLNGSSRASSVSGLRAEQGALCPGLRSFVKRDLWRGDEVSKNLSKMKG
jgi:hypothetical protein